MQRQLRRQPHPARRWLISVRCRCSHDLAVGGLNHSNLPQFDADMKAIAAGLTNLINNPTALAGIENGLAPADAALTTIHLDTC